MRLKQIIISLGLIAAHLMVLVSGANAERLLRSYIQRSELQELSGSLTQQSTTFHLRGFHLRLPKIGAVRIKLLKSAKKSWLSERRYAPGDLFAESGQLFLAKAALSAIHSKQRSKVALAFFPEQDGYVLSVHVLEGRSVGAAFIKLQDSERATRLASYRTIERSSLLKLSCAEISPDGSGSAKSLGAIAQTQHPESQIIELATVADYELYSRLGENTNNVIASIVNAADSIYHSSFGIELKIVHQEVRVLPDPALDSPYPELLLQQLKNTGADSPVWADLVHLFTGKALLEQTIGIAFTGSVCSEMQYRYGVTQYLDGVSEYITFAHELGHSLGATHDDYSGPNLMSSVLDPHGTEFSAFSIKQISNYLGRYSQCLLIDGAPNEQLSVKLVREARRKHFYRLQIRLTNDQGWLTSRIAQIMYRRSARHAFVLLGQIEVDERGSFISTRLKGQYLVQVLNQPNTAQTIALRPKSRSHSS